MLIDKIKNSHAFIIRIKDYAKWVVPFIVIYRLIACIFITIFHLLGLLVNSIVYLISQYKWAKIAAVVLSTIAIIGIIDFGMFYGKAYPGVHVADLDLSNKTQQEAIQLINDNFSSRISGNTVTVYANEEAQMAGREIDANQNLNEELSMSEVKSNIQYWQTNAVELEATLPAEDIANDALNACRGLNNIFNRISALFVGYRVAPYATYSTDALKTQTEKINSIIGESVVNPTVAINDGVACSTPGKDGNLVLVEEYENQLNEAFFQAEPINCNFVPKLSHVATDISDAAAQQLSGKVNTALKNDITICYDGHEVPISTLQLGNFIEVTINCEQEDNSNGGCSNKAISNNNSIKAGASNTLIYNYIVGMLKDTTSYNNISVKISNDSNGFTVHTNGDAQIPLYSTISTQLNNLIFNDCIVFDKDVKQNSGSNNKENSNNDSNQSEGNHYDIEVPKTNIPEQMSMDEAMGLGLIVPVSSYTTSYSTGAGTENRNHNIELVSSKLNNSLCTSDGGSWSFNNIAGNCDAAAGFLPAGTVEGSKIVKSDGGGICQVATTIFNCVYESGFPITSRSPHGMHIASYPAGRDAAISWPLPDLEWVNSTNSDVLLSVTTTGYSVTATMYGINYGYRVESEEGQWTETADYSREIVVDTSKKEGSSFVQTAGSKGKSITVKRRVYNRDGKLIREDAFISQYKPKTEIIVIGPGEEANKLLESKQARMKEPDDNW